MKPRDVAGNAVEKEEEDTDTDDALHKICCPAEIQGCYESRTRLSYRNFAVKLKNNTDSFRAPTGRLYTDFAARLKYDTAILETQVRGPPGWGVRIGLTTLFY